jgi:hypothetical protein
LVCLLDTLFDRCPAGLAYLLTGLLLCGCWYARRQHGSNRYQHAEPDFSDRTHLGLPGLDHPAPTAGLKRVRYPPAYRGRRTRQLWVFWPCEYPSGHRARKGIRTGNIFCGKLSEQELAFGLNTAVLKSVCGPAVAYCSEKPTRNRSESRPSALPSASILWFSRRHAQRGRWDNDT